MKPEPQRIADQRRVEMASDRQDVEPRCEQCGRMLARVLTKPYRVDCPRCHHPNERA